MIRLATYDDLPRLVEIGAEFHREAALDAVAGYVPADCEKALRHLIDSQDGIVLVADVDGQVIGTAGGMANPYYFNHGHRTGMELFWWVEPVHRRGLGRLLFDALENEARALGCESWAMIALEAIEPERTGSIYRRRGYRPSEHTYIKRL